MNEDDIMVSFYETNSLYHESAEFLGGRNKLNWLKKGCMMILPRFLQYFVCALSSRNVCLVVKSGKTFLFSFPRKGGSRF